MNRKGNVVMNGSKLIVSAVFSLCSWGMLPAAMAQQDFPPPLDAPSDDNFSDQDGFGLMTGDRLAALVQRIDPEARAVGNGFAFSVNGQPLNLVFDETANRMRVLTPIVGIDGIPPELLMRTLQANFDAVLDARYAIGNGQLWSVFVHPLESLTDRDFLSGVAQTAIAAQTFGTTFSSGAFVFGGGDTQGLHDDLLKQLEEDAARADERGI